MRKNISYCHPSFSLENVQGSSNSKEIKSGRSLDLAYQLGAMTRRGYSRDCHVNNDNNSLSYVREADNKNLLAGELEKLSNLTQSTSPQSSPSKERKNISYSHPSFSLENVKGASNYEIIKSGRSLDLAFQLGAMTMVGLFSFNAHSACTPTPDCASIGYTETSCEGASLKCPFDISKMKCMPCDSSYRYTCSGDNITGGEGNTCNGKYASCTCASGFNFENGDCKCPASITTTSCNVGAIYYPDGKCSNDYVACLNPVGVVVKDNALVMSWRTGSIRWGGYGTDISDLPNYSNSTNAKADYNGKDNTTKIVAHFGEDVDTTLHAGVFCYNYAPVGMESTKGQWYLPAAGELYDYVYGNYTILRNIYKTHLGYNNFEYVFWSSSEESDYIAWYVYSDYDTVYSLSKNNNYSVSCFLTIN